MRAQTFTAFCAILVLFSPPSAQAQGPEVWSNLDLYGGQIFDIAVDPTNPDKMFAGSYLGGGLFVTTDGGDVWQRVVAAETMPGEDTFRNHAVWAVKIAPSDPNVIWVAHNHWVEKSTDGGNTWTHIWNGTMQSPSGGTCTNCPSSWDQWRWCKSIAVDPSDADTIYVGTAGAYNNWWNDQGAIYRTMDGGEHWTKLNDGANFDHEVMDLAIDNSDPDVTILWAVTSNRGTFIQEAAPEDTVADGTLYRGEIDRITGEETWAEVFSMEGGVFYEVKIKPNDPDSIFTANDWGIFRHYYDGGEWRCQWILDVGQELPSEGEVFARNVRALAFDPQNPDVLYASWQNIVSKWDGVDTRAKIALGTPPYEDADWQIFTADYLFFDLEVHPERSNLVYGGEVNQGVFESQNHGEAWRPINNGISAQLVNDIETDPNDATHFLAATSTGLYEKRGAGDWNRISGGTFSTVFSVAFEPGVSDGSTYYVGTERYLAKTMDSGNTWILSEMLVNDFVTDIAVSPNSSDVFITTRKVGGAEGPAGVYKNEDRLATPTLAGVLLSDEFDFNVVAFDPNDPTHVFAGGGNYFGRSVLGNLYESTGGGDAGSWRLTGLTDVIVNALLIDPRNSDSIYAGCGYSGGTDFPVFVSTDGGKNWLPSQEGMPDSPITGRGIWGVSETEVFAVGTGGGVFHYDGLEWIPMHSHTSSFLYDVWGISGSDVFAVGTDGTVLHYDGSEWTEMNSGTTEELRGVWGSSGPNVFAVANSGTIVHYDGSNWNQIDAPGLPQVDFRSVWGASKTDVFVCGYEGTILHYDGVDWTEMASGTSETLFGLWGISGRDVFAVGDRGTILHYDGKTWATMESGSTEMLLDVWGASAVDIFAVGANGTILRYDGTEWHMMDSGKDSDIWSVWGTSETNVFAVGHWRYEDGGIIHYDGQSWSGMLPDAVRYNAVSDMAFHPANKDIVYASTTAVGVYVSPNNARNWINLGVPEFHVDAISTGSLYAATQGELLQCTGTGLIAGQVRNAVSRAGIDRARVSNDLGATALSISGEYMMVSPAGICDVTATAADYVDTRAQDITVLGGDVAWTHLDMPPVSKVVQTMPHDEAGIADQSFVSTDTSVAIRIQDPEGIDIRDPAAVEFTIDDGRQEYTRNLTDSCVRVKKVVATEPDSQVTELIVSYDRCNDQGVGDFAPGSTVQVQIDVEGTTQAACDFKVETENQQKARMDALIVSELSGGDPALDPSQGFDTGEEVTGGTLKGAKIVYNSDELVCPGFGPSHDLPSMTLTTGSPVGEPLNLTPEKWAFDSPVKIFIPCPGYVDVSELSVYLYDDGHWAMACDAAGNVLAAGDGWMVRDSRVNHNGGSPPTIELQVYHFSGIQAVADTSQPTPPNTKVGGSGGGGGGCFVSSTLR